VLPAFLMFALFLTAIISRANALRGMSAFRTALFLPQVVASIVVATIWLSIYSQNGLLNQALRLVGLGSVARVWLGDYALALPAVGLVGTWLNVGLCLVLFLSGVGDIPPSTVPAFEAYNRAFNGNGGGFALPTKIDIGNFGAAWTQGHFGTYMISSLVVTVVVVALTTVLATLAGFAFARLEFAGSGIIFFILLAGLMLPAEAFIIPLYFDMRATGLTDTYESLILPQTAQSLAFAVFWMRNQFRAFPGEIIEAARLDGARDLRLLWQVMVPSSRAPIMTMCVLIAMWTWNEFLIPLVLVTSEDRRTAPLGLAFFQNAHLTDYSLLSAAGVLVALPVVILYFFLQKRFISGMFGGISVK